MHDSSSQTALRLNGSGTPFPGRILADRYKILELTDTGTFNAHDLALDQSVKVTEVISACQRDHSFLYHKIRQLALARNNNFLNFVDVVRGKSSDYVISERPRGRPIAELLYEQAPLSPDDILDLIRPLAGALDLLAVTGSWSNIVSARMLYAESRYSDACMRAGSYRDDHSRIYGSASFSIKLDVWELVRPRKDNSRSRLLWMLQESGSRGPAARQLALLTYELLGGENIGAIEGVGDFRPVRRLGKAGNNILRRALEGSPCFKNAGAWSRELESAIRSDASGRHIRATRTWRTPPAFLRTSSPSHVVDAALEQFNAKRLSPVLCLALLFTVLMPESGLAPGNTRLQRSEGKSGFASTVNVAPPLSIAPATAMNAEYSNFAVVPGLELSRSIGEPNGSESVLKHRRILESATRSRTDHERYRPSGWSTVLGVRKHFIALWHKSLRQSDESGSHQQHWRAND